MLVLFESICRDTEKAGSAHQVDRREIGPALCALTKVEVKSNLHGDRLEDIHRSANA